MFDRRAKRNSTIWPPHSKVNAIVPRDSRSKSMTWRNYIRFVVHLADALAVCPTFVLMLCRLCSTEWNWESETNDCRHGGESTIPKRWKTTRRQRSARELSNEGKFRTLGDSSPNPRQMQTDSKRAPPQISKMEHMSQQQYVTVEGIDNSNARALVVKLINVVLTILQVVLLLVATAAGIIMPFLKTR